ncbi:MAG: sugar transferase [Nitrospiraceae bacterium]|nr:sugar transferase [Nitrospiraceae bacterium]
MMKRLIDITLSLMAVILFLPFGLIIALILRFTGEGEIFYLQPRVGKDGRIFNLIKFATMLKDSPNIGTGDITVKHDPRVLPFGGFLRKTKLNEVPQVLNILKGDMSIVGPRPQTPKYFAYFPESLQPTIKSMRPGLTGVGSIVFRDEESIIAKLGGDPIEAHKNKIAPYKAELEGWYKQNRSLILDLKLIWFTALVVLRPGDISKKNLLKDLPPASF